MSAKRVFHGISELEQAVGTYLGWSDWHPITQQQIDVVAQSTGDREWIHDDPLRPATGPFGTKIAHGYLTFSLVPILDFEVYAVEDIRMGVNSGANRVRVPAPVRSESRVRAGVKLLSLVKGAGGWQLFARVTVGLEGTAKPACVAETVSVLVP